jgi:MFS family permease
VYLLFNLVYSLSAVPAGITADAFGKRRVLLMGFVLFAAVYYGFGVATSATAIWVLFGLYGIFMGLTEGIQKAYLATIVPAQVKATAFGVYSTAIGISKFPASLIAGWLWDTVSPAMTFYFGAVTSLLSAVLFMLLIAVSRDSDRQVRNRQ